MERKEVDTSILDDTCESTSNLEGVATNIPPQSSELVFHQVQYNHICK